MLNESLPEMLLVAKYCVEFRKDPNQWLSEGCYGYPAALILLSIVDSIGSYIEQGSVANHFSILNNQEYYNLNLEQSTIKVIYNYYRNTLSHHTVLTKNIALDIGQIGDNLIDKVNNCYILKLVPFYNISVDVINKFLNNPEILKNNKTIEYINKKI
ncbi:MAG: hypothetical protein WC860_07430 [Candidatus Margulisiibacteriota bacterium]